MKTTWIPLSLAVVLLSGCTSMMYGGGVAPVNNQNYYGQPRQPVNAYTPQPVRPYAQQTAPVVQQPVNQQVTQVPMVPPSARPVEPSRTVAQPRTDIREVSPSPYGQASNNTNNTNQNTNTASSDDGWSVKPTATDTPKLPENTPTATDSTVSNQTVKNDAPKPVRPPQNTDTTNAADSQAQQQSTAQSSNQAPASQASTSAASDAPKTQQVASNTGVSGGASAVSVLLKKANAELGKGNLDGAADYLQDAQRIDSKNAKILYDIANIRYHQKRYRDAEAAAARAVNTGGSSTMMKKSWSLIANARKALGDNQGAIQAAEKASSL